MKTNTLIVILLGISIYISGCKKEEESKPTFIGSYKVVKYKIKDYSYVLFHDSYSFSVLREDTFYHCRKIQSNNYQLKGDLLLGEIGGNMQYYRTLFSGDTLFLLENENDKYNGENLILLKDAAAPTSDNWIPKVAIGNLLNALNDVDITLTGSYITSYFNNTFFNYNKENRIIESTVETSNSISALETQGTNWWVGNYSDQLLKVRQTDGVVLYTSPVLANFIHSIAFDGVNAIYCVYNASNADKLTVFNISTSSFSAPADVLEGIRDLAYNSGKLYAAAEDYIYKIDPFTLKVEKTYAIKDYKVLSIAAEGNDFWVLIRDKNYESYYTKISLN